MYYGRGDSSSSLQPAAAAADGSGVMTSRILARALAAAACLLVPSTAAAAAPDPGSWTGPVVTFSVDADGLLVDPAVRVAARRRCRALSVVLGDAVRVRAGGRFSARVAVGRGRAARVKGRFVSATSASGTLRVRGGRRGCRLRTLRWTASLTSPPPVSEPVAEEPVEEVYEDGPWGEEQYADDEEYAEEDGDFWEEPTDEEIAAEGDPFE
jgi:hypothetical protein